MGYIFFVGLFHSLSQPGFIPAHPGSFFVLKGAMYGLAATPARFQERWLRPQTSIRNLYLTGTDICTPGVAGALVGSWLTASAIMGRNIGGIVAKGAELW